MKRDYTIDTENSYKIGLDEIKGLEQAMRQVFKPIENAIRKTAYWETENDGLVNTVEYKSRDGFSAHSHNRGGIMIDIIVPKPEQYGFDFLTFGEYEPSCQGMSQEEQDEEYETEQGDGLLDARLRIWFKFEGLDENGNLNFYLTVDGGNGDAPYFRVEHLEEIFESQFQTKTLAGLKRAAAKHVNAIVKILGGAK